MARHRVALAGAVLAALVPFAGCGGGGLEDDLVGRKVPFGTVTKAACLEDRNEDDVSSCVVQTDSESGGGILCSVLMRDGEIREVFCR